MPTVKNIFIMRRYFLKYCIVLITQIIIIKGVQPNNNSSDESRHPRGRVVKLYSGSKHEPITCNNEGFLADPVDCSNFYRCIKASRGKYTVLKFQCSPGTVYDPEIETCNHPQNTKRSECRSSRPFQYVTAPVEQVNDNDIDPAVQEFPSPITTRKPIYEKQTDAISDLPNAYFIPTTHFPPLVPNAIQSPVYGMYGPSNEVQSTIKAQTNENIRTTELQTKMSSIISTTQYQWPSMNQYGPSTSVTATRLRNECVHDGFMGDTEDCRKFYRCVNDQRGGFKKFEFMCSDSTIWDDDIQSCNHPWAVRQRRCGRDTSSSDYMSRHEENNSLKNNSVIEKELYSNELNTTEIPVKVNLPLSTSNQIYYGDRLNIDDNIVWNNRKNASNLIKDQEKQTNYPIKEKEIDYITQLYETITKASSYIPYEVNQDVSYNTNTPFHKVISNTCNESGFMGDSQDCRKFYRCVENGRGSFIRHEFQCGEGTAWDKNIESCNHIWMVKECKDRVISNSFSTERHDYETSPNIVRDDTSSVSDGYNHQNDNEQHISRSTTVLPVVTQILNESLMLNRSQEICNSVGFMANQNNCKIFYRCVENSNGGFTKFEYLCDEGTAWDPNIEACNHADLVKHCGINFENQTKVSTSSTESTIITTVSFVQTTIQSSDNNFVSDVSYVPANHRETTAKSSITGQVNMENKCKESGFMADIYDCRRFYRCVDNGNGVFTRFEYLCGEDTVWDKNINACNHLWAVENCGSEFIVLNKTTPLPLSENDHNLNYNHSDDIYKDPSRPTESTTVVNLTNITATSSNKINACLNSGFIGDAHDCKKFYRCVSNGDGSFKQYEFSCGEGTVWDPEVEACNHAWAVKKCGGSSNILNEASTIRSTTMIIPNSEFDSGYTTQVYNQTKIPVKNTTGVSTNKVPDSDKRLHCETVGFMADKNDCKRFYRCVENGLGGFDRFEFSCGEGTAWDSNIHACNHAALVKDCGAINLNTTTSSPVKITTQSMTTTPIEGDKNIPNETQTESTTTIKTSYAKNTCTFEGFYADVNDCKKFYRCVANEQGVFIKYEFSCGEGTVWDQNIQACNHESIDTMNCKKSTTPLITKSPQTVIAPSSTESYTTLYVQESSTKKSSDYKPVVGSTCVAEGFFPNSNDCKKFFRCVNNGKGYIRYDFSCGEGTIWVQAIQGCDHENDNSTCNTQSVTVNESNESTTTYATHSQTNMAHSEAPNIDVEFNKTSTQSNAQSNECHSEGYYEKANDCRQFYRCVLSDQGTYTKYDYICSEGTAWDVDKKSCNHIDAVKRCQSTNVLDIQSTTMNRLEEETKATEAIMTTKSSTMASELTSVNVDECEKEGYFGNKKDCQKFYRCVEDGKGNFMRYDYICGDGTIWDQDILTCNHPRDVTNRSCDNGTTNASSTAITEASMQSTTSASTSTQSSSISTQTATSPLSTQAATTSSSAQTETSSMPIETTTSSMSTQTETSSMSTQTTSSKPTETTTSSIPTQATTSSNEGSSQETPICSEEGTSKHPKNENITCTKAGYFANPSDCKKFYRCVDWDGDGRRFSVFHFECGEGTIWDPALDTCNYEESVYPPRNCSATQTQNNNTSQTTSTDHTTRTESTTTIPPSSTETTSTQSTLTNQISSSTATPTDTVSTTMTSTDTTSTTVTHTDMTSTTVAPTDTTSTTSDQITSEHSTTDISTTQSDKSTTTNTSSTDEQTTLSEKTSTTTEVTTSMTEQQTTTTLEQSSTEQPTTQTTVSATDGITVQGSTTSEQTSTDSSTETSTNSASTTEGSEGTTTQGSSSAKDCPDTDDDQYLYVCPTSFKRHPKYCNIFYQCIENNDNHELNIATFNCPNGTIYDESKIQCVEESKAEKKCQGAIAKNRRIKRLNLYSKEMITVSENKYECSGVGHYPFDKNEECSPAILKCEISKRGKLQGFVYRCPDNYIYWSVSRRCEPNSMMTACKNSSNQWIGRSEIPIERKNVA